MIVDKKNGQIVPEGQTSAPMAEETAQTREIAQMPANGLIDVYKAIKTIIKEIQWEYGNPNSPKIFKTVQRNDGQFERIIKRGINQEDAIAFPACFIHFVNVHWLKPNGRIKEGRAEVRIKFVMNRLNVHDNDDTETEIDYVAERIKQDIELKRNDYECLTERLTLDYYDPMSSFDKSLQACWMNFDLWFRETNIWVTRNWVKRHIVVPPYTNHADQDPKIEGINPHSHDNLDHKTTYDETSKFVFEGVEPTVPPEDEEGGGEEDSETSENEE